MASAEQEAAAAAAAEPVASTSAPVVQQKMAVDNPTDGGKKRERSPAVEVAQKKAKVEAPPTADEPKRCVLLHLPHASRCTYR